MIAPPDPERGAVDHGVAPDLRQQIDRLRRRVRGFKDSEGSRVDLRRVDPAIYGAPPRPVQSGPAQFAWDRAFGLPLIIEPFHFPDQLANPFTLRRLLKTVPSTPSRFETSHNWSGAYITANRGRHFGQIWGFWRIPETLTVPPPPFAGDPALPYDAVNWIGLDGQRDYLDSSLPQIGTQAQLDPETRQVTATTWMQWWANKDTNTLGPVPIGLTASPGDFVGAVLTAIGPTTAWGGMVNLSTRRWGALAMDAPTVRLSDGTTSQPSIQGATAEWIMERSEVLGQKLQNNLPDYGMTEFELCVAVEAWDTNPFSLLDGIPKILSGARYIRMIDFLPGPMRTVYISMPEKLNDWTVRIRYGGFPA